MLNKTIIAVLSVVLLIPAGGKAGAEQNESALQIYLPGEVAVESDAPNLGQVAIIRGDESLAAKAGEIALGRIPAPGQKIVIDRSTLLSRLACNGINVSEVKLTGAEKITIRQQHQIIKSEEFVQKALDFLRQSSSETSICQWNPLRVPEDLILSGISKDVRLSPCLLSSGTRSQAKVQVAVFSEDREMGMREVTFRLKYNCRVAVARVDIPQGGVIGPENVKVEETVSDAPESASQTVPYGYVAKRRIPADTVISANMVASVTPQVLLERNQNVVIKISRFGLLVTAIGKAMQEGRVGEYIKVQNSDSQRIIMAKVNEDGSVEPVF